MRFLRASIGSFVFVFLTGLALASGCGGGSSPPEDNQDQQVTPADEVRVMDESARDALEQSDFDIDANEGTLTFDAANAFAQSIDQGAILASRPVGDVAPAGLLQRVKSVRDDGDKIVVTTRQATLAETFQQADFEGQRDLNTSDVTATQPLAEGVTIEPTPAEGGGQGLREREQAAGQPLTLNFDKVLVDTDGDHDTTDDQIKLDGDVSFGVSFETALKVRRFKLRRFLFAVDVEQSAHVDVTGDLNQANIDREKQVAKVNINTIVFQVGPVPVVINIDLIVKIGVDGEVTAELHASASQSSSLRLGAEYTDDAGWHPIKERSSTFDVPPPQFSLSDANIRGYVRPQLEIKLYGLAGPYVFAEPYARFDAKLYRDPYWKINAGLNFGVGFVVRLPVLGEVANWDASVPAFEKTVGTSSNAPPKVEVLSPEDGVTKTADGSVQLTVTAKDRESRGVDVSITGEGVDQTYTVFEGDQVDATINDLCQGTPTYTITARDEAGATTSVNFSAVVENAAPSITIDDSLLTGMGAPRIFPGGYMSAAASVEDPRCDSADPINTDLIAWYLDGQRVARAPELLTRLSPTTYSAGDTVLVQARFDDGQAVAQSRTVDVDVQTQPSGDLPAEVNITQCDVCGSSVFMGGTSGYIPNEITVRGVAFDPKEGELSGSRLHWELVNVDRQEHHDLGTGNSVTFKMNEVFVDPGRADGQNKIIVSVDDGGQTITDSGTFTMILGG